MSEPATRQKRVLVLVSFWSMGGAPHAALRLAAGLRDRGHEAEVWFLYRRTAVPLPDPTARVLVDRDISGSVGYLSLPWYLLRRLRAFRPDGVITFLPLAHIMGQFAALLNGIRARVASHRVVCTEYGAFLRVLDRVYGSIGIYSRIVAVSDAVAKSVSGYPHAYRRRVSVVHNGVDWPSSSSTRAGARAAFALPAGKKLLLAVGRLADQKNYPLLIEAIAGLEDVCLVVAGDGPLREMLMQQARRLGMESRLLLLGQIPRDRIADLYRACDAFVLASLYEGQSNALLEAMAEGMLIFASDIPEQRETLVDGMGTAAGVLLPLGDPLAWRDAIRETFVRPGEIDRLGCLARERSRHFTTDRMIQGFQDALAAR